MPYKVRVIGRGGLTDTLAEFMNKDQAERFVSEVKKIDPEVKLEIVETPMELSSPFIIGIIAGVVSIPIIALLIWRGVSGVVQG
jgi:hypothetical protein